MDEQIRRKIVLSLILLTVYVGVSFWVPYSKLWVMKDLMQTQSRMFFAFPSTGRVRDYLGGKAEELQLRLKPEDVRVQNINGEIIYIEMSWEAPVDIFFYHTTLHFNPKIFGLVRGFASQYASQEITAHLDAIASAFSRAGARVVDVELPESGTRIHEVGRLVLRVEAAAYHRRWFSQHAAAYSPKIRELVESGQTVSAVDYLLAHEHRYQFRRDMHGVFRRCDVLLLPAAPAPAPPLSEGTTGDPVFCAPWSFAGFPAISLPSGLSRAGLPLAIQLVAPMVAEERLLDAARWCEATLEFTAEPSL